MLDGSEQENRRYAWLLLGKLRYKENPALARSTAVALIQAAVSDSFHAKNATSFKYLYYNAVKIMQSSKVKQPKVVTI